MLCKCKICKKRFETEAPSRIKDSVCAECLPDEMKKRNSIDNQRSRK